MVPLPGEMRAATERRTTRMLSATSTFRRAWVLTLSVSLLVLKITILTTRRDCITWSVGPASVALWWRLPIHTVSHLPISHGWAISRAHTIMIPTYGLSQ